MGANLGIWCCCGCAATDLVTCGGCNDLTPASLTVTFSGIVTSTCDDCRADCQTNTDRSFSLINGFDPNNTFALTHQGSCLWRATISNAVEFRTYTDGTCATLDVSDNIDVIIDLQVITAATPDVWRLEMYTSDPTQAEGPLGFFYANNVTMDTDGGNTICATIAATFTNAHADCDETTPVAPQADCTGGTGGTATVVCA